jgi:hypothetical protein
MNTIFVLYVMFLAPVVENGAIVGSIVTSSFQTEFREGPDNREACKSAAWAHVEAAKAFTYKVATACVPKSIGKLEVKPKPQNSEPLPALRPEFAI